MRARSTVTRVLTNAAGTKATGVEYYDANKERQVQQANAVVLAAWAGQNPRLLLNSATDKHPQGLANSSGLLGKYMMAHFGSGTWAIFDEDVQNHMGTTGAQYMSYERYGKTSREGTFGSTFIVAGSALKTSELGGLANARPDLFGPELAAFMKRALRGITQGTVASPRIEMGLGVINSAAVSASNTSRTGASTGDVLMADLHKSQTNPDMLGATGGLSASVANRTGGQAASGTQLGSRLWRARLFEDAEHR